MEQSYARLRARLEGISDAKFFWQPRPESWTIYEDRPVHWTYHGGHEHLRSVHLTILTEVLG